MCPQRLQEILTDFTEALPSRILEFIPGAINDLHFLQNIICRSYGMRTLCLVLIFLASMACRRESCGSVLALDIALSIKICIRSKAIFRRYGFTTFMVAAPKN